jgi:succinyl-diaminopimelate desuccinylase
VPRFRAMSDLANRLAERTLELIDIPSESRNEAAIAEHVRSAVPASFALEYEGDDAFVWSSPRHEGRPLLVLAGHYDTVPAQENLPGRIEDGWVVGLGASDMKGGLAVMLELARTLDAEGVEPALDLVLLAFGKEELPAEFSPLPALFDASRLVHQAELAILLEPTDCTIQAGCLGNLNARITFHGVSGHSARPWTAENAIDKAIDGLRAYAGIEPRPVDIGGLTFTEVASVTRIEGGIATNVIPDRVEANVNFRYAPDRSPAEADAYLRSLLPEGASYEHAGDSPPARVVTDSRLVQRLRAAGELDLEPKQAWTNVADFTSRGIDAINFGPGATRYAHRRDERVEIAALERAFAALRGFVTGTV